MSVSMFMEEGFLSVSVLAAGALSGNGL